jgi:group I intron endonuclease
MIKTGIYQIKNLITNKVYVGSASGRGGFNERWRIHKNLLNKNKHHSRYLQSSWNKYGQETFEFTIIEEVERDKCIEREQYWLDYYNSANAEFGYNMCPLAHSSLGYKHSEEVVEKIRQANLGRKLSDEQKEILRKVNTGKIVSEETREKLRQKNSGTNAYMYGKKHTSEAKNKIIKSKEKYLYLITHPDGTEEVVNNIKGFCRSHDVSPAYLYGYINGKYPYCKGYKAKRLGLIEQEIKGVINADNTKSTNSNINCI